MIKRVILSILTIIAVLFAGLFSSFLVWANTGGKYRGQIEACLAAREK